MHPYRDTPVAVRQPIELDPDELVIYGLLALIGAIPVAIALARRAMFGFDATLGLLMVCAGLAGVVVHLGRARWKRT